MASNQTAPPRSYSAANLQVMVAKDIVSLAPFRETGFYAGEAAGFVGDIPLWRRDMDSHQAGILYPQHAHLSSEA